jgi:tight adherence protein C
MGAIGALAGVLSPASALACPLLAFAGYRLPAVVASRRDRRRRQSLHAALPETADLLAVSLNAGLNVALALQRAVPCAPEPMRSELARVDGEIALGRPLRTSLEALADRTGSDEVRTLVSILTGGDRFGTRVAGSMERWAADLWTRRRHELEAEARRAPVKILFPLVFLILPAVLLTTVAPLLLSSLRALGYGP